MAAPALGGDGADDDIAGGHSGNGRRARRAGCRRPCVGDTLASAVSRGPLSVGKARPGVGSVQLSRPPTRYTINALPISGADNQPGFAMAEVGGWLFWTQVLIGGIGGSAFTLMVEFVRAFRNRPRLVIKFASEPQYVTKTPIGATGDSPTLNNFGIWIRARLKNEGSSVARNCRAFVTNIVVEQYSGHRLIYENEDAIPMKWSLRANDEKIDLPPDITQFVDICHVLETEPDKLHSDARILPFRLLPFWQLPGKYKVTVVVTADETEPASTEVCFYWAGHYDRIKAIEPFE